MFSLFLIELPDVIPRCHKTQSVSEIVADNWSHTPNRYRNWCKYRVAGTAPNLPHRPRRPNQVAFKERDCDGVLFPERCSTSASHFGSLAIGVLASSSRMPYLSEGQVWSGSPSRCCVTCGSVGTTAGSHSGRVGSPRSWTSCVRSPDYGETCRQCWSVEPQRRAREMGLWSGKFDQSRTRFGRTKWRWRRGSARF